MTFSFLADSKGVKAIKNKKKNRKKKDLPKDISRNDPAKVHKKVTGFL